MAGLGQTLRDNLRSGTPDDWTLNNLLSIGQQYLIMRRLGVPLELGIKMPAWLSSRAASDKSPPGQS